MKYTDGLKYGHNQGHFINGMMEESDKLSKVTPLSKVAPVDGNTFCSDLLSENSHCVSGPE